MARKYGARILTRSVLQFYDEVRVSVWYLYLILGAAICWSSGIGIFWTWLSAGVLLKGYVKDSWGIFGEVL